MILAYRRLTRITSRYIRYGLSYRYPADIYNTLFTSNITSIIAFTIVSTIATTSYNI